MSTPAQVEANRLNAQHSTGPRTPDGKAASAQNATRHGFAAAATLDVERHLLAGEDAAALDAYHRDLVARLVPRGPVEQTLVERLAVLHWRQRRLGLVEVGVYRQHPDPQDPEQMQALIRQLNHLARYENTLLRLAKAAQAELDGLQRDRIELAQYRRQRERAMAAQAADDAADDDDDGQDDAHDAPPPAPPATPPRPAATAQNEAKPAAAAQPPKCVMPMIARVASPGELAVAKLLSKKR